MHGPSSSAKTSFFIVTYRVFGMGAFLLTVRPILNVLASVTTVSAFSRAGISALLVTVFARAIPGFVRARNVIARSKTAGAQFEVSTR